MRLYYRSALAVVAAVAAVAAAPNPAPAQEVNRVVRTLDRVLNPQDARGYEERARREHRADEEHYWHDYRAGLEAQTRDRRHYGDEARQHEQEARRAHRSDEERYWHDYRQGLDQGRR